jgi:hypothetical protein
MTEATASTPAAGSDPETHDPESGLDPETRLDPETHDPESGLDWSDPDAPGPELAPTAVESVINALLEAGPDVAEHIVRSAQELLLAAQTIVDAAQRAVEEQQSLRRPAARTDPASDTVAGTLPEDAGSTATVHRLDVGE